jgi:predicted metal-dependent hydrolase
VEHGVLLNGRQDYFEEYTYVRHESNTWNDGMCSRAVEGGGVEHLKLDDAWKLLPVYDGAKRAEVMHEWQKSLLHEVVPPLIQKWERKLNVRVSGYFLQRMKTKWGSCNHAEGNIRLNTELVKKPKDLLEYVVVHEMAHLIEPTHSDRFIAILEEHYPSWREARAELNELPLAAEVWKE